MPYDEVRTEWLRHSEWQAANVDIAVSEPGEVAAIFSGLLLGGLGGGVAGMFAMACNPSGAVSCEDAGALMFVGGLLGTGIGALLGAAAGQGLYRSGAPIYSWSPPATGSAASP